MTWYYRTTGIHTRVRVYMNGALCGTLTFRTEEFEQIRNSRNDSISFALEDDHG